MTQIPLYFLPGTQCDNALWQKVFERLSPRFKAIALAIPRGKDLPSIVEKLHKELPAGQLNLIGFSLGGYVASLFATTYPQQINQLLIIANAPKALPLTEVQTRRQTLDYIKHHGYNGMPKARVRQMLSPVNHQTHEIVDIMLQMDKRGGESMLVSQLSGTTQRADLLGPLNQQPFPTKFVVGEHDNLVNINELKRSLLSDQLSIEQLENCGHMSPLESPQAVAHIIEQYFRTDSGIA